MRQNTFGFRKAVSLLLVLGESATPHRFSGGEL
jgi:hypothetical protein